jgi:hypothetical protein
LAKAFTKKEKKKESTYPSDCGSHKSMVNMEATQKLHPLVDFDDLTDKDMVVVTAEKGDYLTPKGRLDSGLADVNRYS